MSGWARLAAALLLLAICHALAPYALAVAAVLVVLFAVTCIGLVWLLAATRHTWGWPPWPAPAGPGQAGGWR